MVGWQWAWARQAEVNIIGKKRAVEYQPVREAVLYRRLFTAGWFSVREKYYSRLEIYNRLRASEQADL